MNKEYITKLEELIDMQKRQIKTAKLMVKSQEKRLNEFRKELAKAKAANK